MGYLCDHIAIMLDDKARGTIVGSAIDKMHCSFRIPLDLIIWSVKYLRMQRAGGLKEG